MFATARVFLRNSPAGHTALAIAYLLMRRDSSTPLCAIKYSVDRRFASNIPVVFLGSSCQEATDVEGIAPSASAWWRFESCPNNDRVVAGSGLTLGKMDHLQRAFGTSAA